MSARERTVDFGAPAEYGAHVFRVEIPPARGGEVLIVEHYGFRGGDGGVPLEEPRVRLPRRVWAQIAEPARHDFNARLKAAGLKAARWRSGVTLVERLLGRELCVLAWAAERATDEEIPVIVAKWSALRPEERWWLFLVTAAEAGAPEDADRGWRRALHLALADGKPHRRPRPREEDPTPLPLFG